jgi:hypothetical protein
VRSGDASIAIAFTHAFQSKVAVRTLQSLPVGEPRTSAKGDIRQIEGAINARIEALSFQLGQSGYSVPTITEYLQRLLGQDSDFRYLIFKDRNGNFLAICPAERAYTVLTHASGSTKEDMAKLFADAASGNYDATQLRRMLSSVLPQCVGVEAAVKVNDDYQVVLEQMNARHADWLPVINATQEFVGTVERSALVSSLLLQVAAQVQGTSNSPALNEAHPEPRQSVQGRQTGPIPLPRGSYLPGSLSTSAEGLPKR